MTNIEGDDAGRTRPARETVGPVSTRGGASASPSGWREDDFKREAYRRQSSSGRAAAADLGRAGRAPDARAATSVRHSGEIAGLDRWASLFGGGLLLAWGLRRGGLSGLVGAGLGGMLAFAGANGRMPSAAAPLTATEEEQRIAAEKGWSTAAVTASSVTVNRTADALYGEWRDFSRLARIFAHVESIEDLGGDRARWTVKAPGGRTVSWIARVTDDRKGRRVAWESEPGADVRNAGWVEFSPAPGKRGTEVKALIVYEPPAGQLGRQIARLFMEEPGIQLREDLRRFKQRMETGGAATAETPRPA